MTNDPGRPCRRCGAKLDGKYLLRSNDPHLSAEDIALGYKQLLEVERGAIQPILDLRPVHHRLEDRIRAHVVLCWLALLLIRITETTTGETWTNLRRELQRLHVGTFTGPAGTYRQTTHPTPRAVPATGHARPRAAAADPRPGHHPQPDRPLSCPGLVTRRAPLPRAFPQVN